MANRSLVETEPVSLTAAVTAAVNSTLGILAILFDWSAEVSGGLLAASGAWIVVFFILYTRAQVTPNANVALTTDQEVLINLGKAEAATTSAAREEVAYQLPYTPPSKPTEPPPTV